MNNQLQSQTAFEDPIRNTTSFRTASRSEIDEHIIELAFTQGRLDNKPVSTSSTWLEVREITSRPLEVADCTLEEYQAANNNSRAEMKDGMGIVPAKLKDQKLGRKSENIDTVSMIVLDIDCGMSMEEVKGVMQGTESVVHTTFSHTPEHPKLRVLIPLQKPVSPLHAKAILHQMQDRFGGRLDSACFDVAHMFYLPRCPKDAEALFQSIHLEGQPLDLTEEVDQRFTSEFATPLRSLPTKSSSTVTAEDVPVGARNSTLTSKVGKWLQKGYSEDEIQESALAWNKRLHAPLDEKEVTATVRSVMKTVEKKHAALVEAADAAVATLNKEYVFLKKKAMIVRLSDGKVVPKEQMRDLYANTMVSNGDEWSTRKQTAFDAWFKSPKRNQLDDFIMAPGQGHVADNCLNLWRGWGVTPRSGDVTPWTELVNHLFGECSEDAKHFEQWVAYPIQHPGTKLSTATVIWSTQQGIGKSLIGATIARLYGQHATTISARELHDPYNGWAKSALFVVGEENSASDRRSDSNRLKYMITGETHHINEKYQPALELKNLSNFLFTSNHPDAFHVEKDDRRLFIVCANAPPKPPEFYKRYGDWMKSSDGQAALMDHLMRLDLTGFNPHGHAPHTSARNEMIEMSKTDVERFAADVFTDDFVDNVMHGEIISLDELTDRFNSTTKGSKSNPTAISRALRRCDAYARKRISTTNGRRMLISIRNHDKWVTADNCEWTDEYEKGISARISGAMSL